MKARYKVDHFTGELTMVENENGESVLDSTPIEVPAGFRRPPTLEEQIRRLVRVAVDDRDADKVETFDEADDFDVGDDFDPSSPYETFFDPVLNREVTPDDFIRNEKVYEARYKKAFEQQFRFIDEDGIIQDNLYRAKHRRGAGVSPADSSSAAKPPHGEQSSQAKPSGQ